MAGGYGRRDTGDSDYRHRGKADQGMGGLMTKIPWDAKEWPKWARRQEYPK